MRNAPGELAHRLHFLELTQDVLRPGELIGRAELIAGEERLAAIAVGRGFAACRRGLEPRGSQRSAVHI